MTEAIAVRLTNSFPSNPFRQWQITDISIVNEYFVCIDFHTALGNATIQFNKICFFYTSRCGAVITKTLLLLLLLVS